GRYYFRCQCDCGKEVELFSSNVRKGHTQSCGSCEGFPVRQAGSRRLYCARRRARRLGLPATFTMAQQTFMSQYWGYACAVCGRQEGFQWIIADDHWISLTAPDCPGTVAHNIIPLCHGQDCCNNSKSDREPMTWLIDKLGRRKARAKL